MEKEKTLVLVKPDGLIRGLSGKIISRFEKVGLKIVAMKLVRVNDDFAKKHYPVTDEWYEKVGNNTLDDCKKYNFDVKKTFGTSNPKEIGKKVHEWNVNMLTSNPVIAMVIEGVHAIETTRKIAGETVPRVAIPGTIRGDYTSCSALSSNIKGRAIHNLVHTSKNQEEANFEINLWFDESEILEYKKLDEDCI